MTDRIWHWADVAWYVGLPPLGFALWVCAIVAELLSIASKPQDEVTHDR